MRSIIKRAIIKFAPLYLLKKLLEKEILVMWTENNDGINMPSFMDASEHSGASEPEIVPVVVPCEPHSTVDCPVCKCSHNGAWTVGELPGGRKIVHCSLCGAWKDAA